MIEQYPVATIKTASLTSISIQTSKDVVHEQAPTRHIASRRTSCRAWLRAAEASRQQSVHAGNHEQLQLGEGVSSRSNTPRHAWMDRWVGIADMLCCVVYRCERAAHTLQSALSTTEMHLAGIADFLLLSSLRHIGMNSFTTCPRTRSTTLSIPYDIITWKQASSPTLIIPSPHSTPFHVKY